MESDQGVIVDLYFPRKCSATGRLIGAKDHAAIQFNVANVDSTGVMDGTYHTFAISGAVRARAESDDSIDRIATQSGYLKNVWSYQK